MDEAFPRQPEVASCSQALVLMGDFSPPSVCWRAGTDLGSWGRDLGTGGKQTSLLPSRRSEGGPRDLQASQPYLGAWNCDGTAHPGNHFQPRE